MSVSRRNIPFNWTIVAAGVVLVAVWSGYKSITSEPVESAPEVSALMDEENKKSPARETNSDEEVTRVTSASRFGGDVISDAWPPQPKGITEIKAVKQVAARESTDRTAGNKSTDLRTAREIAESSRDVQVLLGNRYAFLQERKITAKWSKEDLRDEVVFYSYEQNITVKTTVEQGQVVNVEGIVPTEFQPPLAEVEKQRAIEIARDYWRLAGDMRIDELEGFSILTYDGEDTHAVRMVYVTFHYNSTINPELLTWVDLTNERVDRSLVQRAEVGQ